MAEKTRLDSFLCELEDTLNEDRAQGKPIKTLWGFVEVVQRAAAKATTGESNVLKGDHGMYLIAHPDGSVRADSWNPNGDWEKFTVIPFADETVAFKTSHGKYLTATTDGRLLADAKDITGDCQQFELIHRENNMVLIKSAHDRYIIAMPDGSVHANSDNPDGTWEAFEMTKLAKDFILSREKLFSYLDNLSAQGSHFESLTYVVNQWSLGGVVRLKHHGCILAEAGQQRYLKFDFGRWGVGWTLSDAYPDHPKGTCLVETYKIKGDPQRLKTYLVGVEPFSWTANNCSTFSHGIIQELCSEQSAPSYDPWPTWSHCVANPPVRVPPILPSCTPWTTDAIDVNGTRERVPSVEGIIVEVGSSPDVATDDVGFVLNI